MSTQESDLRNIHFLVSDASAETVETFEIETEGSDRVRRTSKLKFLVGCLAIGITLIILTSMAVRLSLCRK